MSGEALWDAFVAAGVERSVAVDDGVAALRIDQVQTAATRARLDTLAHDAFQIGVQSLLLGAEDVGELALACERCMDLLAGGELATELGLPILASSTHTLRQAFAALANPDRSGARTEGLPLQAARYELETLIPLPGGRASAGGPDVPVSALVRPRADAAQATPTRPAATPAPTSTSPMAAPDSMPSPAATASADLSGVSEIRTAAYGEAEPAPAAWVWEPTVDPDMVALFFDEAAERIEDLSIKLLDIEQRPGDAELLRDVFRDLHTLKGSSAMVALDPMNRLAHAAEDLVGQLREGQRTVDGLIIDALLGALDGLRDIAAYAKERRPIDFDFDPIVSRLRDPYAAAPAAATLGADADPDVDAVDAVHADADADARGAAGGEPRAQAPARRPRTASASQTIRVDFDKLDRLMNLVGELVLSRDGLRSAIQALVSIGGELSSDRQLTRWLTDARRAASNRSGQVHDALSRLSSEINQVERVLVDISQDLDHATGRLDSVSDDLRDQVMKLRMVPVGGVFRKHHRTVRDLGAALGKRVRLIISGEDTELDKLLVEALDEPLMHLVRNAVDHGVEPPEARIQAGKPAEGTVRLGAAHQGNQMIITIADDGKGIDADKLRARARERGLHTDDELAAMDDRQILEVIFRPGFSTAAQVSAVSGRGVGMDVVKQAIVTRLKGTIDIDSALGAGTTFTLRLPLTLAIIQVLLARTGGEVFAIPLDSVIRTITCTPDQIQLIGDREVIEVRGRQVPLIRLSTVLELEPDTFGGYGGYGPRDLLQVVLIEVGGDTMGLACEHLLGKKEIVIKTLGDLLETVPCAAGATILGDRCAIILDIPAIVDRALRRGSPPPRRPAAGHKLEQSAAPPTSAPHVLLVEDSDMIRESLRRMLVEAGYQCTVAADGVEGLEAALSGRYDLISTDVMMPRMDGYELTRALRARPEYRDTPIVMVTSRGERIDRVRGFDAGVDEYITKPHDRQMLLRAVRKLLGHPRGGGA